MVRRRSYVFVTYTGLIGLRGSSSEMLNGAVRKRQQDKSNLIAKPGSHFELRLATTDFRTFPFAELQSNGFSCYRLPVHDTPVDCLTCLAQCYLRYGVVQLLLPVPAICKPIEPKIDFLENRLAAANLPTRLTPHPCQNQAVRLL